MKDKTRGSQMENFFNVSLFLKSMIVETAEIFSYHLY